MTTYAIGDIQGCIKPLKYLLNKVAFNPAKDHLWLVGDVVNRGPSSLKVLRLLYQMQDSVTLVLGNHDLHLLACNHNPAFMKPKDTIKKILKAEDKNKLLSWLQTHSLLHIDESRKMLLVHAGILPNWTINQAQQNAQMVKSVLTNPKQAKIFLENLYGNESKHPKLTDPYLAHLRFITNVFTRMRFCNTKGIIDLQHKGNAKNAPANFYPWFDLARQSADYGIIFGHWAALEGKCSQPKIWALDTGYIWGGKMTMLNLDNFEQVQCPQLD